MLQFEDKESRDRAEENWPTSFSVQKNLYICQLGKEKR